MDFTNMLGFQPPVPTGPVGGPGYAPLLNPAPAAAPAAPVIAPGVQQANLLRAMGLAGAALAQPMAFGESPLSKMGQAFGVGRTAYDAGTAAQIAQDAALRKEGRETAESDARIGLVGAQTEGAKATTEKTTLETDTARKTQDDVVRKAKNSADLVIQQLENAKREGKVTELTLAKAERLDKIWQTIPDPDVREGLIAEYKDKVAKLELTKAQIGKAKAEAGTEAAKKGYYEALGNAWSTGAKTPGGKTGAKSAVVQGAEFYKNEWKTSNPKQPGEDDAAYEAKASAAAVRFMQQSKS